jgi:CubicO group peptidase (beta-lactamase class C family)
MTAEITPSYRDPKNPGAPIIPRAEWDLGPYNRWSFQNVRDLTPTTRVWRGTGGAAALPETIEHIGGLRFTHDGVEHSVDDVLANTFTDGFLVMHRGAVVSETYLNGMQRQTPHLSQSVAKSVTGTVAGILIHKGLIDPEALVTHYLPELEATAYRGAKVQHVLDMTSGVLFDESYTSPDSHMAKVDIACGWKDLRDPTWPTTMWDFILTLTELEIPHGETFRYRSIETDVLAFIMQRATGKMLADLVSEHLWVPLGAEEDAYFTVDRGGYALADGGFNATLRDYGRFAQMITNGGSFNGKQIVPAEWIATSKAGNHAIFGPIYQVVLPNGAYHNQFWIEDVDRPILVGRGVFGQILYMDQDAEFTAVKLSSWPEFLNADRTKLTLAMIRAIREALAS